MLYAKVVVGIPVEGPFDYSVPSSFYRRIKVGMRVWVQFRTQKMVGYTVRFSKETSIKNIKPILDIIDDSPVLDKNMLSLTKELSDYYGCSWGEAIEAALPEGIRKGRPLPKIGKPAILTSNQNILASKITHADIFSNETLLIHDWNRVARWDIYLNEIESALGRNKSVIILLPDKSSIVKTRKIIEAKIGRVPGVLYRKQNQELMEWFNVKEKKFDIIIGTRSTVFAPLDNLGLIIIDEEQDSVYKQDHVPHYHARKIAFMRTEIAKGKLILGSTMPSLESMYLVKRGKIKYMPLPRRKGFPEVKIIDMHQSPHILRKRNAILSKYLEDSILGALNERGKILLFLNRKGFATFASCRNCGVALKCPRCNINLVYHFQENTLNCHYCNYKMQASEICPNCNSGYIRYLGIGTEKIESELTRIFPQARVRRLDSIKGIDIGSADIFISTKSIIKETDYNFDLVGILSIDNSLNRIDFRSTEKTFSLLIGLLALTDKRVIIQTNLPRHYCLRAIENKDINMFYEEELRERRQLKFPPFKHFSIVKLRAKNEERVKKISTDLFNKLKMINKDKSINIVSVNLGQPAKLRGNFYRQILVRGNSPYKMTKFLKLNLKNFSHSGIIITLDTDPL